MKVGTNKERLLDVDVRPNAGIIRSPLDEIRAIQTLLADIYKDAGDGRTLFRELVQNADDAGAQRLGLVVLKRGWSDARNSLLCGPALLVVNDGAFPDKDRKALHKAIGGSKEDEVGKIGTFGIGLKSVFHICEAFLYMGAANSVWRAGVLNPWSGTGERGDTDPLHPDWDEIVPRDAERLRALVTELLGNVNRGFLLWIPLRRPEHLNRGAEGRRYGLGERCPNPDDLCTWFGCSVSAVLLLAQCGYLKTIGTERAAGPESLRDRKKLVRVARQVAEWVGRHREDADPLPDREFRGEIFSDEEHWSVTGTEARGIESLRRLRSHVDWPQSPQWQNGRYSSVPRKALAHAAVTVVRPSDIPADPLGTRLRWAVFLPLDDDPEPRTGVIVEGKGSSPAWEIILHGYFWPSQDRRSIPGVTDAIGNPAGDSDMRSRWNRALCDELLLPLLPSALADATNGIEERVARKFLEDVVQADLVKSRVSVVMRRRWLLPVVSTGGVQWKSLDSHSCTVLSIPRWSQVPTIVRGRFATTCDDCTDSVVFIDHDAPRIAGDLDTWNSDRLKRLLNCFPDEAFRSSKSLQWIEGFVRHVIGPEPGGEDDRAVTVARWLAGRIGDGALGYTTRISVSRDSREELREVWRNLCESMPKTWLVNAPLDSQQAVGELAAEGMFGEGLFPVPFGGWRGGSRIIPRRDQERLDRAIFALGTKLETGGETRRLRRSRLLLAETLLSVRDDRPYGEHLIGLPVLRATRLPEGQEEALSIAELRCCIESRRVFASPISDVPKYDESERTPLERPSDSKQAVTELAKALDEAIWFVSGDAAASVDADVPSPTPDELANAVLRAEVFADPVNRKPLLMRLATEASDHTNIRRAARVLLAGRAAGVVGEHTILFHDRTGNGQTLPTLLRLLDRSWCVVQGTLVESLPQDILEALSVGQADHQALRELLGECLVMPVDWSEVSDAETLQLLQDFYGATLDEQKRWCAIPLHRGVDRVRGPFNSRARRSTEKAGELRLPLELEAEVRLLDPDPEIAQLYSSVPYMDRDGLLQLLLEDSCPCRFAEQILEGVRSVDGDISLPAAPDLRELLRCRCWLPHGDGGGLAPDSVLVAPEPVLNAVAQLASSEAFGDKVFPDAVDSRCWEAAGPVVREILGRLSRERQLQRIVDALDSEKVALVDQGAWLVAQDPDLVDASLIEDALQTTLAGSHPGWRLVHAADVALSGAVADGRHDSRETVVKLARVLCAPVPADRQIEILTNLADHKPAANSPAGRLFRTALKSFTETEDFFAHVLPKLHLPTQDGNWHASRDVARTEIGVARRHRIVHDLRPTLRLDSGDPILYPSSEGNSQTATGLEALEEYFSSWRDRIPHGAVGAFLSLLGNGLRNSIGDLAQQWLGEDVAVESIEGFDRDTVSVFVSPQVARGDHVSAINLLGSRVEMEVDADHDTLFAIDPVLHPPSRSSALAPLGAFWEIVLRDVGPRNRTPSELLLLLGGTVERWASRHLELDRAQVNHWWFRWGRGSQADVGPVLASIKAHLPLTLQQLDVKESEALWDALREAERAQRKREQAPSAEALQIEREAVDRLATLIHEPDHQLLLWKRVRELMRRYGYGEESVLLELAQNADDALAEGAEINGRSLPSATRRLVIRVHVHNGTHTVEVVHWGRPINDTGGAVFPAGRERQWDQDLYFMMLMNLSAKPGESPGESSSASTTGRFGLGFKSVHLVSSSPSVDSGFIAFSIAGGLLPRERVVPDDADSWTIKGRRPTRVKLPLNGVLDTGTLIDQLFRRFAYARVFLPVFARQVREVIVEGGPFPGVHVFDGKPIEGASGWSVGAEIEVPNHIGRWRILRYRPFDAGQHEMGTVALAVGLRDGVPTAFGSDVPFLWNVTPTSENWGCGYVVNGPFKLDPGRTHVSLDESTTLRTVRSLGEALGSGLIELSKVSLQPTVAWLDALSVRDRRGFLSSLWRVLAHGLNVPDSKREAFLRELHGKGRGLSAWMGACSVVPSGLSAPYRPVLPPIESGVRIEVASDDLENHLCAVLAKIEDEDMAALVESRCIVSMEIEELLRPLCNMAGIKGDCIASTPLLPFELFAELAERWEHRMTPERLHALRPMDTGQANSFAAYDPKGVTWRSALQARAMDGRLRPLRSLLLRFAPGPSDQIDADSTDELMRAAFAPDCQVLDPIYIQCSEDWRIFRWLRVQHRIDAAMMAEWCADLRERLQPVAIQYLLYGELGSSVLKHLVPIDGRPTWLREYDEVNLLVENQCDQPWRRQSLLGALFPDRFTVPEPPPGPFPPESETFFEGLLEWWNDEDVRIRVKSTYEKAAWPDWLRRDGIARSLQLDSATHWLALLVLGACQSLGRTRDEQHRSFLEWIHNEGWWDVFKNPDDIQSWMSVLRDWQDNASARLTYLRWMSLFPMIYQLSRYRDVYVRLLKSAGRRPEGMHEITRLLSPRVDEVLTGAGANFDAPPAPLNMGLHWVLRELVRMEVVEGEHLFPDCWVPSEQILRLLGEVGLNRPDDSMSNSQKACAIFDFLGAELGTDAPNLHLSFDVPLRHVASNANLRDQFGLEQ